MPPPSCSAARVPPPPLGGKRGERSGGEEEEAVAVALALAPRRSLLRATESKERGEGRGGGESSGGYEWENRERRGVEWSEGDGGVKEWESFGVFLHACELRTPHAKIPLFLLFWCGYF